MAKFRANQVVMESRDPDNETGWRQIQSTSHKTLTKLVNDLQTPRGETLPQQTLQSPDEDWGTPTAGTPADTFDVQQLLRQRRGVVADDTPPTTLGATAETVVTQSPNTKQTASSTLESFFGKRSSNHPGTVVGSPPRDKLDPIRSSTPPRGPVAMSLSPVGEATPARQYVRDAIASVKARKVATPESLRDDQTPELLRGSTAAFKERIEAGIAERRQQEILKPGLPVHSHPHVSSVVPLEHILSAQEEMNTASTEKIVSALKSQSQAFATTKELDNALSNMENNPRVAKLFERGLLRPQNVANSQYVAAMEKSLQLREERLGVIPTQSARIAKQTPVEYTRTVPRSDGLYRYRRPHLTTSPLFAN